MFNCQKIAYFKNQSLSSFLWAKYNPHKRQKTHVSMCCEKWALCLKVTLLDLTPSPSSPSLDTSPGCCHLLLAASHLSEHCLLSFCLAYVRWGADPTPSHQATGAGPSNIVPLLLAAESRRRGGGDLPCSADSRGGMPVAGLGWCQDPCWDSAGSALRDLCRNGATSLISLTSTYILFSQV